MGMRDSVNTYPAVKRTSIVGLTLWVGLDEVGMIRLYLGGVGMYAYNSAREAIAHNLNPC